MHTLHSMQGCECRACCKQCSSCWAKLCIAVACCTVRYVKVQSGLKLIVMAGVPSCSIPIDGQAGDLWQFVHVDRGLLTFPCRPCRSPARLTSMQGKPAASSSVSCEAKSGHLVCQLRMFMFAQQEEASSPRGRPKM